MPSPFPGMDPYLENPDWFPGLHDNLIVFMSRDPIVPRLKPDQAKWAAALLKPRRRHA
jgi:hypothetical protein